jgi:hypothetical protein
VIQLEGARIEAFIAETDLGDKVYKLRITGDEDQIRQLGHVFLDAVAEGKGKAMIDGCRFVVRVK